MSSGMKNRCEENEDSNDSVQIWHCLVKGKDHIKGGFTEDTDD